MRSSTKLKFLFLFLLSLPGASVRPLMAADAGRQEAFVQEALTGDSVRLAGGKTLVYAAIQAPPLQHIIPLVRQYGADSLSFNKKLVEGKKVLIQWGPQIRGDHGQFIGYVFLADGTFVNQSILAQGHAKLRLKAPNLLYADALRRAELDARRKRLGLWEKEAQNPYIQKAYIGDKNTKIYYLPNSPELEKIPAANLVTFNSRVDAKAAGYKRCFSCKEDEVIY